MVAERLMVAFAGTTLPAEVADRIADRPPAGVTLFPRHNLANPAQVRSLTDALQAAAPAANRPLLVAADQEGGQLIGLGPSTTQFAGALALGAAADESLSERVARATGRELRALGVNVNYAPVCDLANAPANPALGIRSFGDDPQAVGRLVAATVRGLQAEGVAATLKHFPGAGDTQTDPHEALPLIERTAAELEAYELAPFWAGLDAGARLVMASHVAVPALTGDDTLPASLSRAVIFDLLREGLGFDGLALTDALDMLALAQGAAQVDNAVAALAAGEDLLLGTPDAELLARLEAGLAQAVRDGLLDVEADNASGQRLAALRQWLAGFEQPPLDVVGSTEHQQLARELARRSITLVRDDGGLLPLRRDRDRRVAVIHSRPSDLTPADTSSTVEPKLAAALRRRLPGTVELLLPALPSAADIAAARERARGFDVLVVGTFAAQLQPAQAALAQSLLELGKPTITVALRTPWDLPTYPAATTHICSYGILPPTMEALAAAMTGEAGFPGRLPVAMGETYRRGHGLVR